MNPQENFQKVEVIQEEQKPNILTSVTPLSKYLAMIIFITLPFLGGWIGYNYAPEKIIEVERVVIKEHIKEVEDLKIQDEIEIISGWTVYENKDLGVSVQYPDEWRVNQERPQCSDFCIDTIGSTKVVTGDGGSFVESFEPNAYIAFWFDDQDRVQSSASDDYIQNHFCEFSNETVVETSIGGKIAHTCGPVEISEWGWQHEDIYTAVDINGGSVLQVRLVISDLDNKDEYRKMLDKIVETLRF